MVGGYIEFKCKKDFVFKSLLKFYANIENKSHLSASKDLNEQKQLYDKGLLKVDINYVDKTIKVTYLSDENKDRILGRISWLKQIMLKYLIEIKRVDL